MAYHSDYPNEPIGGGNPYYRCVYCNISDPAINGRIEGHASSCEYRRGKELKYPIPVFSYSPATGEHIYPGDPEKWIKMHPGLAWLFDPWSGDVRSAVEVGADTFGEELVVQTRFKDA